MPPSLGAARAAGRRKNEGSVSEITPGGCADAIRRLDDYLDRELSPVDLDRVRRHLEACALCAREFRFEAGLIREVRAKVNRIAVPADLHASVWRAVTRAVDRDASAPPAPSAPGTSPRL